MDVFRALGTIFNDIICYPLGGLLKVFFNGTQNYALLLVIFTLITRFFLFPLAIKQQRSSAEMLRMKPKMEKIQKKYAKDQTKMQEELSKLYQEEGYNPLSGCLPVLIQMPILYGLYQVVYNPLTYIMWFSQATIDKIASVLRPFINSEFHITNFNDPKIQLYIAKAMSRHMDKLGFLGPVKNIDFNLFGIDLSEQPKLAFTVLMLIPILCYLTQAFSTFLNVRMNKQIQQGQAGGGINNVLMVLLLPLMSAWFSFAMPAAVGFYWIVTNLFMVLQTYLLQRFFSLDKLAKQAEVEAEKRKEAIRNGTAKPSLMQRWAKQAMDMQSQQQGGAAAGKTSASAAKLEEPKAAEPEVKLNSKGKKSRSQIKEEQRKRLAKSRNKTSK